MNREMETLLKNPFPANEVQWRIGTTNKRAEERRTGKSNARPTKGIPLPYIDSRSVMRRLDRVCGIDGWQVRYPYPGCCEIGILIDDKWIWKANGAGETRVEGVKGQYSDAFKRAAATWGIGRYLYYMPDVWVDLDEYGRFTPPALPAWAIPDTKRNKE